MKRQAWGAHSQWIHPQDTLRKSGQNDSKNQRLKGFAVRWLPGITGSYALRSHQYNCPAVSSTRTPTNTPNQMDVGPRGLNPIQRTTGNWVKLGVGEGDSLLSSEGKVVQCQSQLRKHIQGTPCRLHGFLWENAYKHASRQLLKWPWICREALGEGLRRKGKEKCCN